MSQKRKSGLQSGLSEIVARQTAPIEAKQTSSATLLERFKETTQTIPSTIAPAIFAAPEEIAAPEKLDVQPLQFAAPEKFAAPAIFAHPEQHTRIPNELFETVLPTLKTSEQSVLLRLYRLTRGFHKATCQVSMGTLANACNLSSRQVTTCVQRLEDRQFIRRISVDLSNMNQQARGVLFEMLLPPSAPAKSAAPAKFAAPATVSAPEEIADNKKNTLKETHTNRSAVRVGSRFTLAECRKYAESLRAEGINNPGGYATRLHRSGEADELIAAYLAPAEAIPKVDASRCPDCTGSGWWYPAGKDKGAARCKHERMMRDEQGTRGQ